MDSSNNVLTNSYNTLHAIHNTIYNNQEDQSQKKHHQQFLFTSRNLINEYIAKTCVPPEILRPSYVPSCHHTSCDKEQIELAYKHPQLLFDFEMNESSSNSDSSSNESEMIQFNDRNDNDDVDDDEESLSRSTTVTTTTTTTTNTTNTGGEVKYFEHAQDNLNCEEKYLRQTLSTTNFHVRNLQLNSGRMHHHHHHHLYCRDNNNSNNFRGDGSNNSRGGGRESPCKLIGKVNPAIARTWKQLNAFNSSSRYLSRSVSNMSDDSEKLFFCQPAVQESKSNFRVNKVIYCEEENSGEEEQNKKEETHKQYQENSENFYDSIDDDGDSYFQDDNTNGVQQHLNSSINLQQQRDAGEQMSEIDSFERRKYFWSLENELK